jgi:hypothetical protein
MLGPHKRSITGAKQEFGVDQRPQQRVARRSVQAPEPLCLRRCQAESGHFYVFPLDTPENVVKRLLCCHVLLLLFAGYRERDLFSNHNAIGRSRWCLSCTPRRTPTMARSWAERPTRHSQYFNPFNDDEV